MKQSTFSAVMANKLLTVLQGYSKTIRLLLVMFLTLSVSAEVWAEDFEKYSGAITEGDYLIVYSNGAMKNTVSSDRLEYSTVTVSNNKISNPNVSLIWHIAPSGDYWTIYNASVDKYAAGTGVKNKAQLLESGTDNKSLWTVSGTSTYEFVNKANKAAGVNSNLRRNGNYGFACYGTGTGGALTLYKKAASFTITATSNNNSYGTVSVSGTTITATPNAGYRVKSGAAGYTVTSGTAVVTNNGNNTFSVTPSSNCTITINFEEIPKYTVTWNVNGEVYETTQVTEGSKPTFPATPSSCDATSNTFYGWATATWDGKINDVSAKTIYTSANNMPAEAATYYAVFCEGGGGSVLINEEFDNTSTSDLTSAFNSSEFSNFSGATAKAYKSKYGGVKFGSSSAVGYITSKSLDLSTAFTVTLDACKYSSDAGNIDVTVGTQTKTISNSSLEAAGTFKTFTLEFDAATSTSTVKIGTSSGRAYIDNVIIATGGGASNFITTCAAGDPCDALQAPNVTATATANSITLSWEAVDGATSYNVYNYTTDEAEEVNVLTYTFNGLDPETEYAWEVEAVSATCNGKGTQGTTTTSATPCEKLGAATGLTVETDFVHTDGKTYVKFSWTPADNTKNYAASQKLCFGKVGEAGTCVDNLAKNQTWTGDLASKLSAGEYWWSIQALGDGNNYCDGDVVNGPNFYIYSITYNTNGGNTIAATSGTTLPDPLPTPTREHYNFEGWYTDEGCTQAATAGAAITQNTTLYAKWTANTYTITLDANGGKFVKDGNESETIEIQYVYGTYADYDQAKLISDYLAEEGIKLSREGYQLNEMWQSNGVAWKRVFTAIDRTIQAQWTKVDCRWIETDIANILPEDEVLVTMKTPLEGKTYTLDYSKGTSTYPPAKLIEIVGNEAKFLVPYHSNSIWNISGDAINGYILRPNGDSRNALYCTASTYNVKVGTNADNTFIIDGGYLKNMTHKVYVGVYNSSDWRHYPANTGNAIAGQTLKFYKRVCVDASIPWYTVTFNAGSGSCDTVSLTGTMNEGITLPTANPPAACATDGWKFAGWWTEAVTETTTSPGELLTADSNYKPTRDCTLYAVYSYTKAGGGDSDVTFNFSDIATANSWTNGTAYTTVTISPITINAIGGGNNGKYYTSNTSWRMYSGGSLQISTDIGKITSVSSNPSKTFTINDEGTATLSFSATTEFKSITVSYSSTTTTYNSNPSCEVCENILSINKGEETNGNTFTLSQIGDIETCDGDVEVLVNPTSAEHYSVSEVTATTPNTGGTPTITDNGDDTWTVTYAQNSKGESTISVTFVEDAKASITLSELGVTSTIDTYYVGEKYTLPTTSSQSCEGKELVGWSTVEVAETDTKPTENYYELGTEVTLAATQIFYAVFATAGEGGVDNTDYSNVHTSNVTLTNEGGTNATNYQVNIGGMNYTAVKAGTGSAMGAVNITVPAGTTKLSFHMAGWNGEGNKTISLSGATADPSSFKTVADAGVSGNNTTYTLSGTIANYFYSTTLSNIDAETTLTFSNGGADQRFVIWGVNASTGGGVSYTGYTTSCFPTYTITYDFAGGTGSHCSNTSVPQGDTYTICEEEPTKEGHTFLGWSVGTDTYAAGETITPTGNVILTAQWQINTYTVIWSNNGATTPVEYNHGVALVVPEAPESCDGVKEFVGWTEDNTFTYHATTPPSDIFTEKTATVTADKTYYAVFATPPGTGGGGGGSETTTTLDFTAQGYANETAISNLTVDGVTATFAKGSNESNAPKYYTNGTAIRAYGGNTITLSANQITAATFTFGSSDGSNDITADCGSWDSPTWTGDATDEVVFTISGSSGNRRIKSIAVTCISGGGSGSYSDYTTICQQIESIEVQEPQTEFYLTDDFTIGEGKVMATLSDGITKVDVTSLATFSGYNMNVVGTYTVTVTYMGATATYNINVKPLENAWVLTWNVSGKTNTGLRPRQVTKGTAIGTLPTPEVPAACEGKTFMGWTESNIVPSDGKGIVYITEETVPTNNTTYYAVFATVNNFCTQKPIDQISSGSKVVIVAVASLTADGGSGKAISSRATDDTYNLQGDDVAIYDQTINTPHSTCIWTISKSGEKYIFIQDGKYLNGVLDGMYSNLKYLNTEDSWTLHPAQSGMTMTYNMESTNASGEYIEWYRGKFAIHNEVNKNGDFDMQFYVTANADGKADITDYTTGCEEYTITYYGFRGGYSTSTSSDGIIVLPVNSAHTVPDCGDVVKDHTDLGREFLNLWMTEPHGGHTFKPGDTFILTQDTTLYAQWELNTTTDVTLPTGVEDLAGTDVYVYGGNTLTMVPDIVTINSLTLKGGLQPDGSYQMPNVWIPDGATLVRNTNKINLDLVVNAKNYYPFAVPFAAKNNQYVEYIDPTLAAASTYGTHFAIKTYDGARRAEVGEDKANNWVRVLREETLQPGVGYIITALTYPDKDTATIRIPMTVPNTWFENGEQTVVGTTVRNTIAVTAHAGAAATEHQRHAGWNFVANPYLTSFAGGNVANDGGLAYINGELIIQGSYEYGGDPVPYVTVPAYDFEYYSQHKLSDVKLSPEWSFFVQIGTGGTMNFTTAGRQQAPASIAARNAEERPVKMDIDINLTDGRNTDQMGIIVCEKYSDAYEIGRDLEKMFGSAYNLVVYSLMSDNTPLAYQAVPLLNETHAIPIGYRAPEQGEYTFSLKQNTSSIDLLNEQYEQLVLVDYEKGALTNLLNSDYTFSSERTQSNSRFALYAVPRQDSSTELPNISDEEDAIRKIFYNGHLFIIRNGNVYNGNGQIVK